MLAHSEIVNVPANDPPVEDTIAVKEPVKLTIFPADFDMALMGTPWLTFEHGFNYVAFDGWTCGGVQGKALRYWMDPAKEMGLVPGPPGSV